MIGDFIYTWRELSKRPGIALTAIASLTLGIGATTAVFSVIYGLLANPYPYRDSDRMVHLTVLDDNGQRDWPSVSGSQYKALRELKVFESVAATWGTWNLTTTGEELPDDVPSVQMTGNSGPHFGVPAMLGRTLLPSDAPDGKDPETVVVLSYLFWQRHYNGDPTVIGRRLELVHKSYTVIGVLPARFTWEDAAVYLPLKISNDPNIRYGPLLRLRPGVTRQAANAELQPLLEQFAKQTPQSFPKKFRVQLRGLNEQFEERLGRSLYLLFGGVSMLLFIGCANVSILLLARGTARQHELSIRSAIGASRWRIQRQLLTEALGLSVAGAIGGVILSYRLLPLIMSWLPEFSFPHEAVIRVSAPVLIFSVALALVSGIISGLAPAFQFSRPALAHLMQSSSRRMAGGSRAKRTHHLLAAAQIALTLLLLTAASASVNGFVKLMHTNLGYDPHHVMSVGIPIHENSHRGWADRSNYFSQLLARVQATPEVAAAAISTNATPPSNGWQMGFEILGRSSAQKEEIRLNFVSPEYFPVLRIPLAAGRLWDSGEVARGARLAIINQTMAHRYWPQGDAIGHEVRMPELKARPPFMEAVPESDQWMQIIGVVADARDDGLRKPVKPAVYVPYKTMMGMWTQLLVRTHGSPLAILNQIRAAVKSVDPDQQVVRNTRDLDQWVQREDEYAYGRLSAALLTSISVVALLLAAIGLFSVVSYGVAQRTNELGIRMALGASRVQVVKLVLQGTATYVLAGLACGSVMSVLLRPVVSKWAEGSTYSVTALSGVTLLLILTAALAAVMPARRASSIEPMEALRYD